MNGGPGEEEQETNTQTSKYQFRHVLRGRGGVAEENQETPTGAQETRETIDQHKTEGIETDYFSHCLVWQVGMCFSWWLEIHRRWPLATTRRKKDQESPRSRAGATKR